MSYTVDQIRKMLSESILEIDEAHIILKETITDIQTNKVNLIITNGWNPHFSIKLTEEWTRFKMQVMKAIDELKLSDDERIKLVREKNLEDTHWDWFNKSRKYQGKEYEWFYIFIDKKPIGCGFLHQPQNSVFDEKKIFYIEYIAIAPWNRDLEIGNQTYIKKYSGLGPKLIKVMAEFAIDKLELDFGFSLHSLPQSYSFYDKIGMVSNSKEDKDTLKYYEMKETETKNFIGRNDG